MILMRQLIFVLLIFCSCSDLNSTYENGIGVEIPYNLEFQFSLTPTNTSTQSRILQLVNKEGQEILYFGDSKSKNRILLFDILKGTMVDEINFESDGPNGIGKMTGFFYQSDDSIFIINSFQYKLFHVNKRGKIIKSYNIKGNKTQGALLPHPTQNPISGILDNKIFFYGVSEKNPYDRDYYNDITVSKSIDIETGEIISGVSFPEKYHNNFFHLSTSINIYQEIMDQNVLQSFSSENEVQLFNSEFEHVTNIIMPHSRISNMGAVQQELINSDEGYYFLYSNGAYRNTIYNKDSDLIYRFAIIPPRNPERYQDFRELKDNVLPGLVIYDFDKKKILGEITFLENELDQFPMHFVGSKGLYISKESDDDHRVDFYLLKIER